MTKTTWIPISDDQVRHIWRKAADDDCIYTPSEIDLPPSWYEENGTPQCACGKDMMYVRTEILKSPREEEAIWQIPRW